MAATLTYDAVIKELRKRNYAALCTVDERGRPHSVGIDYGVAADGRAIYVMTRSHLKKARNIATNPNVAITVPITRRLLWFLPPPSIQFHGTAEILDRTDADGILTFKSFFLGRRILSMYADSERRGETRVCFLRIVPEGQIDTYMVGNSIFELMRRMEAGNAKIEVPDRYRPSGAGSS